MPASASQKDCSRNLGKNYYIYTFPIYVIYFQLTQRSALLLQN